MDLKPQADGRWHFALGPVEKWIVTAVAAVVVAGIGGFVNTITTRLDKQGDTLDALNTQQALTNQQLQTLTLQLADVPNLSRQMAEMKVQVERNTEDIKELRATRGLK